MSVRAVISREGDEEELVVFTFKTIDLFHESKDKQNRLMRIDELHKFSDGTLTYVRTALDDRLKGIRMKKLSSLTNGFSLTMRVVQTSGSGNTFLLAVAFFFRQWEVPSSSGNFLTSSGNALCSLFPTKLACLKEKVLVIIALKDTLRKIKGKGVVDAAVTLHHIDPELLKINVSPLAPELQNNRTAHYDYLKHIQEETTTLREIVKNERLLNRLNTSLGYACKYTKRIQELLIILKQTCHYINDLGDKLMAVTPPSGNTKKDKIQQIQRRAKKNKLEAYPRNVRTSLLNKNSVVNTKDIASVPNSKLNVKSDLQCVTCNGCLFSDNHDSCVLEFINFVNARVKLKFAKKPLNIKICKPTGKVFTNIGYKWRPTGRTFTIVRNACPLTRITTTAKMPLRKPIPLESNTSKPVYLDSGCSKHMTRDRSQLTNFVNKFLGTIKFGNDHVAKIIGYGDYKIGNVTILRVYFVEGLGLNLFSVGQFCNSDLEVAFRQHTCFIRNLEGVDLLPYLEETIYTPCL
nr:integrase, catalytic region, zinc finger, CCHC-type, peptidase aspartic, catalytic [Tanacetum cinerariifolium]